MSYRRLKSPLPTEIYEEIIEWVDALELRLFERKRLSVGQRRIRLSALHSCALTCRAWLPTSRACLYGHLIFISTDKAPLERLVQSLDANPWLRTLITRFDVIADANWFISDVCGSVTHASNPQPTSTISHTWAFMLAGKLPCLHSITVALSDGLARRPQFVRALQTFSIVSTLSLAWFESGSVADLLTSAIY